MLDSKVGIRAIAIAAIVVAACTSDDGDDDANGLGTGGTNVAGMNAAGSGGTSALGNAGKPGTGGAGAMTGTGGAAATGSGGTSAGTGGAGGSGAGGSGGSGSGGATSGTPGTSPSPTDPPDISTCPQPPASATEAEKTAFTAVNTLRLKTGAGCATMIEALNKSSANHCNYYAANSADDTCTADPHGEVESCMMFTGESPGARMKAAGYTGSGASEVMAFTNNPQSAVDMWINSVWHRIPILDPWTTEFGYGAAERCDVIDFGRGTPLPDDTVTVYPYDGQIDVPVEFDGSREGPMPPEPTTGWPSSAPISINAKKLTVTEHVLTKDGDPTPLDHVWLTGEDSNFLRSGVFMYGNAPFEPMTKYRVKVVGTRDGTPINLEWTFTTGMRRGFGRP